MGLAKRSPRSARLSIRAANIVVGSRDCLAPPWKFGVQKHMSWAEEPVERVQNNELLGFGASLGGGLSASRRAETSLHSR